MDARVNLERLEARGKNSPHVPEISDPPEVGEPEEAGDQVDVVRV